jgi:pimeloyl-ACP methyl ester carboxylesterase
MPEIYDHAGDPVRHGRARVNGIRMHYVTAGQGEPLLLLHGTPKTHYYWVQADPPAHRALHGGRPRPSRLRRHRSPHP